MLARIRFTIDGKPQPKERPRFSGHAYTTDRTRDFEALIWQAAFEACPMPVRENLPLPGPCRLSVTAYYPIPEHALRKKGPDKILEGEAYLSAPDVDNVGKIVMDALNHKLYVDDRMVYHMETSKFYSRHTRLVVEVEWV